MTKKKNNIEMEFNNNNTYNRDIRINNLNINQFLEWFVGFTEAEGCFKIKPKYRDGKETVHSFYFEFEIHLHIDDLATLEHISNILGIGKIYLRGTSCSFIVGNEKDIRILLEIFNEFSLNGVKYLDYMDFKTAFLLYFNREGKLTIDITNQILELKNRMNTNRTENELNHDIKITAYYLLGLIEGDGTFSISRNPIRPAVQILFTVTQKPLLIHIREFLINNLGLDKYSIWSINNSSVISINIIKAKGNSKSTVLLEIRDISLLNNYFIPFLDKLKFISKKELDFNDFKIICQALYKGLHKIDNLKDIILKLSYGMNDYRLTTYKGKIEKQAILLEELALINSTQPVFEHLSDGRVKNRLTDLEDYSIFSTVYLIIDLNNQEIIVKSLKVVGDTVGMCTATLSKKLTNDVNFVNINVFLVKRQRVFIK